MVRHVQRLAGHFHALAGSFTVNGEGQEPRDSLFFLSVFISFASAVSIISSKKKERKEPPVPLLFHFRFFFLVNFLFREPQRQLTINKALVSCDCARFRPSAGGWEKSTKRLTSFGQHSDAHLNLALYLALIRRTFKRPHVFFLNRCSA